MVDRRRFDQNNRTTLIVSSTDGSGTPVELWADPTTHELLTTGSGGGGGSVGLFTEPYDEIDVGYPDSVTETYQSKLASVDVQLVTVTYTDSSKDFLDTVIRT